MSMSQPSNFHKKKTMRGKERVMIEIFLVEMEMMSEIESEQV